MKLPGAEKPQDGLGAAPAIGPSPEDARRSGGEIFMGFDAIGRRLVRNEEWTTEELQILRELAGQKKPDSVIASELGRTRNAVRGMAHRKGIQILSRKPKQKRVSSEGKPGDNLMAHRANMRRGSRLTGHLAGVTGIGPRRAPEAMDAEPEMPPGGGVTMEEMNPLHHCRWPVGDPLRPTFRYCGASPAVGPYCHGHHVKSRERRRLDAGGD